MVSSPLPLRQGARPPELQLVQVLRAISCVAVTLIHNAQAAGAFVGRPNEAPYAWLKPLPWDASVDIFFLISGFVMVHASARLFARPGATRLFLFRRVARVIPLYWVATSLLVAVAIALPNALSEPLGGGVGYIAASYFFVPWMRPDGFIQPVFRLGWTLNYEMLFYGIFTVFVAWPRARATAAIVATVAALVAAGIALRPSLPQFVFWSDPIMLEFAAGMLVATMTLRGATLPVPLRWALAAAGVLMLWAEGTDDGPWRVVTYGVPATLFLMACVMGPEGRMTHPMLRLGVLLGDASYALYLVHPFPMRAFRLLWSAAGFTGVAGTVTFIAASMVAACAAAVVIHRRVEMPLTRAARRAMGV